MKSDGVTFQSVLEAMEIMKKEIISELTDMSNRYEAIGGNYIIQKTTLDHYVENLKSELS